MGSMGERQRILPSFSQSLISQLMASMRMKRFKEGDTEIVVLKMFVLVASYAERTRKGQHRFFYRARFHLQIIVSERNTLVCTDAAEEVLLIVIETIISHREYRSRRRSWLCGRGWLPSLGGRAAVLRRVCKCTNPVGRFNFFNTLL